VIKTFLPRLFINLGSGSAPVFDEEPSRGGLTHRPHREKFDRKRFRNSAEQLILEELEDGVELQDASAIGYKKLRDAQMNLGDLFEEHFDNASAPSESNPFGNYARQRRQPSIPPNRTGKRRQGLRRRRPPPIDIAGRQLRIDQQADGQARAPQESIAKMRV